MERTSILKKNIFKKNSLLETLFLNVLKIVYWSEKRLLEILPEMRNAASSVELKNAIEEHVNETFTHVTRLERVFEIMSENSESKKSVGIEGLLNRVESVIRDTKEGTATRDAGLIMAVQKMGHYKMAYYVGLAELASYLGESSVAELMMTSVEEEAKADSLFSEIAVRDINYQASKEFVI
jgi:ferritin-like metal-binding protein YciE